MHWLAGAALVAILTLTVFDIIGRSAFNRPVPGTVEVTSMALVVVVFLAVAHSEDAGDHITIDLIYERLGEKARVVFDVFADIFGIVVLSLMAYRLYQFARRNIDSGAETPVLEWPVWPFVVIAALGALGYAAATIMKLILRLMGLPFEVVDPRDEVSGGIEV